MPGFLDSTGTVGLGERVGEDRSRFGAVLPEIRPENYPKWFPVRIRGSRRGLGLKPCAQPFSAVLKTGGTKKGGCTS